MTDHAASTANLHTLCSTTMEKEDDSPLPTAPSLSRGSGGGCGGWGRVGGTTRLSSPARSPSTNSLVWAMTGVQSTEGNDACEPDVRELGPGGITNALACLHYLDVARIAAVLRLQEACPIWAKKALDLRPIHRHRAWAGWDHGGPRLHPLPRRCPHLRHPMSS